MMATLAQPCERMIKKCLWQGDEVDCINIFQSVKTTNGYCCAFNYFGTKTSEDHFNDPDNLKYAYVGGAGPVLGLRLFLNVEESQYISSIKPSYGFNVLVHDGGDYPDMDLISNTLLGGEALTISVTPKVFVSSPNLESLEPSQRNCLFDDEGDIEWASSYKYKSCLIQCRAKAIYDLCKCVPFYYPLSEHKRICTLLDVNCLQQNEYKGSSSLVLSNQKENGLQVTTKPPGKTESCRCYPECNERKYDLHTDRSKAALMAGYDYTNLSILNVYFNTVGCFKTERGLYYTWDRVLASIGGIFGLCLGGSVISILECFYFGIKCAAKCKIVVQKETGSSKNSRLHIHEVVNQHYLRHKGQTGKKISVYPSENGIQNNIKIKF